MKTLNYQITKKLITGFLSVIILLGSAGLAAAASNEPTKKETEAEKEAIECLKTTFEFNTEIPEDELKNYRVYDANDNLLHEGSLDVTAKNPDKKLIQYLLIADFVMEYDGTKYYKIN